MCCVKPYRACLLQSLFFKLDGWLFLYKYFKIIGNKAALLLRGVYFMDILEELWIYA